MSSKDGITIEKKTMEEALLEAEKILGISRDAMDVAIIREPKRGIFGLMEYNAIIHVKAKKEEMIDLPEEKIDEIEEIVLYDGSVQIVNGKVIVIDPDRDGLAATISPGENVHILINGQLIDKPTEVYSKDEIALVPIQTDPSWEPELRLSKDGLKAFLTVQKIPGQKFFVPDAKPKREALINAQVAEVIEPKIGLLELKSFLQEQDVVFGINEKGLLDAINSPGFEQLVAQGTPVKEGKDASVKVMFFEEEIHPIEGDDELKVMERVARHAVISVEPGQLLAEVVPSIKGTPGRDIYGHVIEPKPVKELTLSAGKGAEIDQEGKRAYAAISGRPEVVKTRVSVHASYTISGDVNAKVGKIIFKGDVQVLGNVLDEMSIEATGKIVINGYTANATIIAGSDVVIRKNVIGGVIRAGGLATVCGKIMISLQEAKEQLPLLLASTKQLLEHPSFAENKDLIRMGHGIIFKMLLGNKFQQLPQKFNDAKQDLHELKNCLDYPNFELFVEEHDRIQKLLSGNGILSLKTVGQAETIFNSYVKHVEQLLEYFQDKSANKANLVVSTVQNSHLECSGEIKILGQGAYNCNIYAGGDVNIQGSPGIFRGGEIVAGGNVTVRELGSPAEISSTVKINAGKSLKAQRIFPRVVVEAGSRVERITYEQSSYFLVGE